MMGTNTFIRVLLIAGLLLVILINLYYVNNEPFASAPAPAPAPIDPSIQVTINELTAILNSVGSTDAPPSPYIEPLSEIPENKNLVLYASTFSDKTNYNTTADVYVPAANKWNNFINDQQAFFISTSKPIPSTIKSPEGLPMKDVRLNGVQSDEINKIDYSLGSFTVTMFVRFTNLTFDNGVIELFNASLESPNYVRLTLEQNPTNALECFLYSQVGDSSVACKSGCTIPIATLTSSSAPTAISMVYTKVSATSGVRQIYINNLESHTTTEYTFANPLVLGNSQIIINKNANLDGTLFSFMFYGTNLSLSQHTDIISYFERQKSALPNIISQVKNMTAEKLAALTKLLADQSSTQDSIQTKLDKCIAQIAQSAPITPAEFKYKISTVGNLPVGGVDSFNIGNRPAPAPSPSPATATVPSQSGAKFEINIPFLNGVTPKQ